MNHAQLSACLKALERGLPGRLGGDVARFRPQFDAEIAQLAAQAEDADDVVYVIERADTMLGDLGLD